MKAIVDDDVYSWIAPWSWCAVEGRNGSFYAQTKWPIALNPDETVRYKTRELHRVILDPNDARPNSQKVDHKNFDTLDCQRENLRWLSDAGSNRHRRYSIKASTGYRGVHQRVCGGVIKYRAVICADRKRIVSSTTDNIEDAIRAYNRLSILHHGEFAHQHELPCRAS